MTSPPIIPKRILVAPLDWGLGHATRCIPLIRELCRLGTEVLIGADGPQATLLREEFPTLTLLPISGYGIRYGSDGSRFGIQMVKQLPRILAAIRRENRELQQIVSSRKIDAVISDNRFGLYHPGLPCVMMTHQLRVKSPFGAFPESWIQRINYHYIERFDACWVVDSEGPGNLAGALSHPVKLPRIPVRFLGCLSRFDLQQEPGPHHDLVILISGPEPQRTIFEELITRQLDSTGLKILIVRGLPGHPSPNRLSETAGIENHLDGMQLNKVLLGADLVLSRSGYSSVMDLVRLGKKAILVPTPGQTEQEYLGAYLMEKGIFLSVSQKGFDLKGVLDAASRFPFQAAESLPMNDYRSVLLDFVSSL